MKTTEKPAPNPARAIDEKVLRQLAGVLPFAPDSFAEWTPDWFLKVPKEFWPVIRLRPFNTETRKMISEAAAAGDLDFPKMREALKQACPGWSSLFDYGSLLRGERVEIPFSHEVLMNDNVIPDSLIGMMYKRVGELTWGMTKEEKEGLESSPPSASEPLSSPAPAADATPA